MESHLTLCSLHEGQTSQDNFAGAAAALEALTDICESPQLVSGQTRSGKWAKLFSLKFGTRDASNLALFWWNKVPAFHLRRFRPPMNLINSEKISNHRCNRGDTPPFENPQNCTVWCGGRTKNGPLFSESFQNGQETKRSGVKACLPLKKGHLWVQRSK